MERKLPKHPVYVISKGRSDRCLTAQALAKDGVPFRLVVEPQEAEAYASRFGRERLCILPFSNLGLGSIPARNWVWEDAKAAGNDRHWILDDNMRAFYRRWKAKRIYCSAGVALRCVEDFAERYENVGLAALAYHFFVPDHRKVLPFFANVHVYSCILIKNDLPIRWRGRYNEDTDLSLQCLAIGLCTILVNAFSVAKAATMSMKGGNTTELYSGDGRLKMARSLERMWPGIVRTIRRFRRPQHYVEWKKFAQPLKLKQGLDRKDIPEFDEESIQLVEVGKVKSRKLQQLLTLRSRRHQAPPGTTAADAVAAGRGEASISQA